MSNSHEKNYNYINFKIDYECYNNLKSDVYYSVVYLYAPTKNLATVIKFLKKYRNRKIDKMK